jgi:hypothetical protein
MCAWNSTSVGCVKSEEEHTQSQRTHCSKNKSPRDLTEKLAACVPIEHDESIDLLLMELLSVSRQYYSNIGIPIGSNHIYDPVRRLRSTSTSDTYEPPKIYGKKGNVQP